MKPRLKLAEAKTAEGKTLTLHEQDHAYSINLDTQVLMHSRTQGSAEALGRLAAPPHIPDPDKAHILIGGLGLGFTLRTALLSAPSTASVVVAELIPEVVDWNRTFLKGLNGNLLDDSRVEVHVGDVTALIRQSPAKSFDAILLDIDNGPIAMVADHNASLYSGSGIRAVRKALKPGGRAVYWSADSDLAFDNRLRREGFTVEAVSSPVYPGAKRAVDILYVADLK